MDTYGAIQDAQIQAAKAQQALDYLYNQQQALMTALPPDAVAEAGFEIYQAARLQSIADAIAAQEAILTEALAEIQNGWTFIDLLLPG